MRTALAHPATLNLALTALVGAVLLYRMPFPEENALLQLVLFEKPQVFYGIKWTYLALLFATPYVGLSLVSSLAYIFIVRKAPASIGGKLPPYPELASREKLALVVGEIHHPRRPEPAEHPRWLVIPDRGLFTGVAIFGAMGSGKTSSCIMPFAEQILGYQADDPKRRVSGLALEVKGDFCRKLK